MRACLTVLAFSLMLAIGGCSKPETVAPSPTSPQPLNTPAGSEPQAALDVCALLTSKEIETIQGAPFQEAKPSSSSQEGVTVSQCYFLLPTAADSIVLTVTYKRDPAGTREPKQLWEKIFHREEGKQDTREEEEHREPEKIADLGDEAFWAPITFGGALYALKANTYIRISVGGSGDQASKLEKSKALAEIVLKRL